MLTTLFKKVCVSVVLISFHSGDHHQLVQCFRVPVDASFVPDFGCRPQFYDVIIVSTLVSFLTSDVVTIPDAAKCVDASTLPVNLVVVSTLKTNVSTLVSDTVLMYQFWYFGVVSKFDTTFTKMQNFSYYSKTPQNFKEWIY